MTYQTFAPPPVLSDYVRFFWAFSGEASPEQPYIYRSMADASTELVLHVSSHFWELSDASDSPHQKQSLAIIHAQSNKYQRFITDQPFQIFGAYLYPYTLPALFGIPAEDLSNQLVAWDAIWAKAGAELMEQTMLATDIHSKINLISRFLLKKMPAQTAPPLLKALRQVVHQPFGLPSVERLASDCNVSVRQLERLCKHYCGFSPKLFTRLLRFHRAMNHYPTAGFGHLTDVAYACGYYDQSHFIHDFKAFSGYHPKQYFFGRTEGIEYREG